MKKYAIPLITLLVTIFINPKFIFASNASTSATPTTTATPSLQDKIKTLVEDRVSSNEANLREKINQRTLVGQVGVIRSINSEHLSITSTDGDDLQITTDAKTVIIKSNKETKFSSLALSDKIIVIGSPVKSDIVLAKKITTVPNETPSVISGTIVAKVVSIDLKNKTINLSINGQVSPFGLTKKSTVKFENLKEGDTIFAITKKYQGKDLLARARTL